MTLSVLARFLPAPCCQRLISSAEGFHLGMWEGGGVVGCFGDSRSVWMLLTLHSFPLVGVMIELIWPFVCNVIYFIRAFSHTLTPQLTPTYHFPKTTVYRLLYVLGDSEHELKENFPEKLLAYISNTIHYYWHKWLATDWHIYYILNTLSFGHIINLQPTNRTASKAINFNSKLYSFTIYEGIVLSQTFLITISYIITTDCMHAETMYLVLSYFL